MLTALLAVLALVLVALATWLVSCPCERMPGAWLSGEQAEQPVTDWSFANQVPLCQIQTRSGLLPHAINLNCMATPQGELYLSCSQCEGKRWSSNALETPSARIRLDDTVYPVRLRRVTTPAELDLAWRTRITKLRSMAGEGGSEALPPRPDHWWSFEVVSAAG